MLAVPGEQTALLRLALFERAEVPVDVLATQLPSLAKNLPVDRLDALAALGRKKLAGNLDGQAATAQSLLDALAQRGAAPGDALRAWGTDLAGQLLVTPDKQTGWTFAALDGSPSGKNPWTFQERPMADGQKGQLMSSHPLGEQLTGVLRSALFAAPDKLRFYLAGHDGTPDQPLGKKNFVRLRDAGTNAVLREVSPPRNDTAQRIEWDLADLKGKRVSVEVVDGDAAPAYAWLAVGRFKPDLPELTLADPAAASRRHVLAAQLARTLRLSALNPQLTALFVDVQGDPETRLAAARALITCNGDPAPVVAAISDAASPVALREQLAAAVGEKPDAAPSLVPALKAAPHLVQKAIALAMAGSQRGCGTLLDAVSAGQASATLLRDKSLADRIRAAGLPGAEDRLAKLTANLPPANEQTEKLLAARRAGYHPEKSDVRRGADVFGRNCAVCHRVGTTGALIGPQLDGVGNRGLDRLVEDILDPNRNVDAAFRMQTITRKDGTVLAGLFRRDEGAQVVFADFTGKEFNLPKADIQARSESETSLMPPGMSEIIPEAEFYDLLAFLLSQRATGQ
jgi:putative heme-binding domain-containing protein